MWTETSNPSVLRQPQINNPYEIRIPPTTHSNQPKTSNYNWSFLDSLDPNQLKTSKNSEKFKNISSLICKAPSLPLEDVEYIQKIFNISKVIIQDLNNKQGKIRTTSVNQKEEIKQLKKQLEQLQDQPKQIIAAKCPVCMQYFATMDYLDLHIESTHSNYSQTWKFLRNPQLYSENNHPVIESNQKPRPEQENVTSLIKELKDQFERTQQINEVKMLNFLTEKISHFENKIDEKMSELRVDTLAQTMPNQYYNDDYINQSGYSQYYRGNSYRSMNHKPELIRRPKSRSNYYNDDNEIEEISGNFDDINPFRPKQRQNWNAHSKINRDSERQFTLTTSQLVSLDGENLSYKPKERPNSQQQMKKTKLIKQSNSKQSSSLFKSENKDYSIEEISQNSANSKTNKFCESNSSTKNIQNIIKDNQIISGNITTSFNDSSNIRPIDHISEIESINLINSDNGPSNHNENSNKNLIVNDSNMINNSESEKKSSIIIDSKHLINSDSEKKSSILNDSNNFRNSESEKKSPMISDSKHLINSDSEKKSSILNDSNNFRNSESEKKNTRNIDTQILANSENGKATSINMDSNNLVNSEIEKKSSILSDNNNLPNSESEKKQLINNDNNHSLNSESSKQMNSENERIKVNIVNDESDHTKQLNSETGHQSISNQLTEKDLPVQDDQNLVKNDQNQTNDESKQYENSFVEKVQSEHSEIISESSSLIEQIAKGSNKSPKNSLIESENSAIQKVHNKKKRLKSNTQTRNESESEPTKKQKRKIKTRNDLNSQHDLSSSEYNSLSSEKPKKTQKRKSSKSLKKKNIDSESSSIILDSDASFEGKRKRSSRSNSSSSALNKNSSSKERINLSKTEINSQSNQSNKEINESESNSFELNKKDEKDFVKPDQNDNQQQENQTPKNINNENNNSTRKDTNSNKDNQTLETQNNTIDNDDEKPTLKDMNNGNQNEKQASKDMKSNLGEDNHNTKDLNDKTENENQNKLNLDNDVPNKNQNTPEEITITMNKEVHYIVVNNDKTNNANNEIELTTNNENIQLNEINPNESIQQELPTNQHDEIIQNNNKINLQQAQNYSSDYYPYSQSSIDSDALFNSDADNPPKQQQSSLNKHHNSKKTNSNLNTQSKSNDDFIQNNINTAPSQSELDKHNLTLNDTDTDIDDRLPLCTFNPFDEILKRQRNPNSFVSKQVEPINSTGSIEFTDEYNQPLDGSNALSILSPNFNSNLNQPVYPNSNNGFLNGNDINTFNTTYNAFLNGTGVNVPSNNFATTNNAFLNGTGVNVLSNTFNTTNNAFLNGTGISVPSNNDSINGTGVSVPMNDYMRNRNTPLGGLNQQPLGGLARRPPGGFNQPLLAPLDSPQQNTRYGGFAQVQNDNFQQQPNRTGGIPRSNPIDVRQLQEIVSQMDQEKMQQENRNQQPEQFGFLTNQQFDNDLYANDHQSRKLQRSKPLGSDLVDQQQNFTSVRANQLRQKNMESENTANSYANHGTNTSQPKGKSGFSVIRASGTMKRQQDDQFYG